MFFLIENVIAVVVALLVAVTAAIGILIATTVQRRQFRDRYFKRLDDLRQHYGPIIAAVLDGRLEYKKGLEALKGFPGRDRLAMLERLCLERKAPPDQLPTLRRLCEDLGLVEAWHRLLSGKGNGAVGRKRLLSGPGLLERLGRLEFLTRAKSAENLGVIHHQPSWPLLVKALQDPHPDVRTVAVHSLSLIGEPQSFPALVQQLHAVVQRPGGTLSLRTAKTAVVSFPLSLAINLVPSLVHQHRRIRFLGTDIIREMVERQAAGKDGFILDSQSFPAELAEMFLTQLPADQNPDVRARAAPVIAYLADNRSADVLLALLEDKEWFVRLHTVRALAKYRFLRYVEHIGRRLIDTHWMVRESAVHTMLQLGQTEHLYDVFLRTADRYSQEQIADEWQRAGVIPTLLHKYAQPDSALETHVLERLAQMGKTSYVLALLETRGDRGVRKKFLENFGRHPDPQVQAWVRELAQREPDAELRALARAALPSRG